MNKIKMNREETGIRRLEKTFDKEKWKKGQTRKKTEE